MPDRFAFEEIVMDISTRHLDLQSDEVDSKINSALQIIGEMTGVDHGYIYLFSDDRTRLTITHEWCSQGYRLETKQSEELPFEHLSWITEKIKKGQIVHISCIADLPPEAKAEKEIFQSQGCRSLILVPMIHGKSSRGFLGFESIGAEKTWPEEMIVLLRLVGEIFIKALQRVRMEKELQEIEEKYRSLVENINEVIFSLDLQGCFTYISRVIEGVAFYEAEEMMGQPFSRFVYPEDLPEFQNNLKNTLSGNSESHEFRLLNKQGNIRHVRISCRRLLENDQPVGLTGILSDISEQKLAEVLLDRAEAKYRNIFANAVEGIFQCTRDGRFIVANPACARILGYTFPEELIIQDSETERPYFVDPERYREFQRLLEENGLIKGYEAQVYRKDGSKIWISANALAIRDPSGAVLFYEGTMEDVTERKEADDQIRYLSFHDNLTGLYNRVYFEEELKRLDTDRQLPISVIMGDLNGLKLVNDAFGHQEGDKLLIQTGKILKDSCRKEDVIARWGGDEFAIFLPKTSYRVTVEVIERIKLACSQAGTQPMELSIALGAGTKDDPSQDTQEILKEAEERMYKDKLLESKKVRTSIISSLQKILFEKSHETEEHTHRLRQLALQMGSALELSDRELDELMLLATLHDLGKIAIPEGIFIKSDKLSLEEWELIWKHPEIGYRIAVSSPELAPIAEAVLSHHEWWNGKGYPRELKGEEIPLPSRIIAIADAYDVMTHQQPYKEAMSREEALQELQRKAGSQFDPQLLPLFIKIVSQGYFDLERH